MSREIIQTDDFSSVVHIYEAATERTLCAFDVDQVLIDPKDAVLSAMGEAVKVKRLQELEAKHSQEMYDFYYSIIVKEREVELLDPKIKETVLKLQHRGVPTFALTAFWDGPYGVIENIGDDRIAQLLSFGFDFGNSQPLSDRLFKNLKSHRLALHPSLKRGVVLTCHVSKGDVLEAYINELDQKPDHVIFIDDRITYIEQVVTSCSEMGIQCTAIHYVGRERIDKKLDMAVADFQWNYLLKNHRWIPDQEVIKMMAHVSQK